jgi:hypothetical protein
MAYRCRHGDNQRSCTQSDPAKNLYIRKDRVLSPPARPAHHPDRINPETGQRATSSQRVLSRLRAWEIALIYEPVTRPFEQAPRRMGMEPAAQGAP